MDYLTKFQGRFIGIMQWDDCDALLEKLIIAPADDWYPYDTLALVPQATIGAGVLIKSLTL